MDTSGGAGTGRSRGRARGRAAQIPVPLEESLGAMQAMRISPTQGSGNGNGNGSGNGSNGNGNGNGNGSNGNGDGAALRGRGGYRGTLENLNTRPENIQTTIGTMGNPIKLFCNYFRLNTPTDVVVNNFHVKFEPNIEAIQLRKRMIYTIANLFDKAYIFDGEANIKTMSQDIAERQLTVKSPVDNTTDILITIRHTEEVPWSSMEMMRLYNTQMRRNLYHIGWKLMGRYYYDVQSRQDLPGFDITLLPGAITAIAQHDGGLLMVVDSSTKFIRKKTVLEVLNQCRKDRGAEWYNEALKLIASQIVMTTYNNRTYKVEDIMKEKNPQNTTFLKNGRQMNLMEYYREQYGITIRIPAQPLISAQLSIRDRRAGKSDMLYLVPELCQLTGLTDQMRADFQLMRKIGDVSRLAPKDRSSKLKEFIEKVNRNENVIEDMKKWSMRLDPNLVEVNGRVLECEKIYMGQDTDTTAQKFIQKTGDFGKEIRSKKLFSARSISKWALIVTQRDSNIVQDFGQTLKRVCDPMGITLGQPNVMRLNDDRTSTFVQTCLNLPSVCEMVVLIVPNNNKDRYDSIKKACYCEHPMPCQVVVSRTLSKKPMLMSVCTKIGIQMAAKVGAQPWALKIPPKDMMVVGYDTYHDSSTKGRSVGGFVCSTNQTLTAWYSRVSYHSNKEEMSANFAINLKEGIKAYFEKNKTLPKKIVIYRDGVGEGDIPHVFTFELKEQILTAIKAMSGDVPIQLSFIIVTKRVNARFFLSQDRGQVDNPIPGTLIDETVTRPNRYDFYLISQSVRQGTVTPTMYNIIYDTTPFKAEHHQQLAYKLTHLYFNWQGTIRVPAPCQYAHKLAYLTGTSLHREPASTLSDLLFYL